MLRRAVAAILAVITAVSLTACAEGRVSYTCAELTLTFPEGYAEQTAPDGANMLLSDGKSTVTFKRLSHVDAESSGISTSYTAMQFAEFFLVNSEIEGTLHTYADIPYYPYYETSEGVELFCLAAFYRTPYAYFIIIFATSSERESEAREEFFEIMKSTTMQIVD